MFDDMNNKIPQFYVYIEPDTVCTFYCYIFNFLELSYQEPYSRFLRTLWNYNNNGMSHLL